MIRFVVPLFAANMDPSKSISILLADTHTDGVPSKVVIVRSDGGGEFRSEKFVDLCRSRGINQEFTTSDSPQFNGVAERHGCTSFHFLVEVRGNDRGTSMDFRGCCPRLPWKSAGFHGKGHGSWRFHGKCHGCGHGTCRGSARGKLRGTTHGSARKPAAIAGRQTTATSMAIRGHCLSF